MLILQPPVQFIFRKGYYNTFRGSSFVHDSWKKKLSQAHIRIIEKGCEKFMSANNYKRFIYTRKETMNSWIYTYIYSTYYMFNKSRNNHSGSRESESRRVGGNGYREGTTTNSHNESHNNNSHLREIVEERAEQTRTCAKSEVSF